jgi:hypothetical protein
MSIKINCKVCKKPTDKINIFNGECVDCMVESTSNDCDKYSGIDIEITRSPPEVPDPLHSYGGYVFDKDEPHI